MEPLSAGLLDIVGFGSLKLSTGVCANVFVIYSFQMGAAITDPSAPCFISEESLLPTHTPVATPGVYPMVHASLLSFVVPVFAATGLSLSTRRLFSPKINAREELSERI